jgi:hypothetical protein
VKRFARNEQDTEVQRNWDDWPAWERSEREKHMSEDNDTRQRDEAQPLLLHLMPQMSAFVQAPANGFFFPSFSGIEREALSY